MFVLLGSLLMICFGASHINAQFSGATIHLNPSALTKLASTQLKPLTEVVVADFSFALPASPLPTMPRCLFSSPNKVVLSALSIAAINVSVSQLQSELLITLNTVAATTAPIQFAVQCVLDTPAGKVSMDVAGTTTVQIPPQSLSGTFAVALDNLTQVPVAGDFFPTTSFAPELTYSYAASTSKFPFDGYVAEYLQSSVRLSVTQAFRNTLADSLTNSAGSFLSRSFTIFPQTCSVTFSAEMPSLVFNVRPVCSTITTGDAVPRSDILLLAPSTNVSIPLQIAMASGCQGTKCWPYATLPAGWIEVFKDCQFCVVNSGSAVAQTADIELQSP